MNGTWVVYFLPAQGCRGVCSQLEWEQLLATKPEDGVGRRFISAPRRLFIVPQAYRFDLPSGDFWDGFELSNPDIYSGIGAIEFDRLDDAGLWVACTDQDCLTFEPAL